MITPRTLRLWQLAVVVLSLCGPAGMTTFYLAGTGAIDDRSVWLITFMPLLGLFLPFVLRGFLNRLLRSVQTAPPISLAWAIAGIWFPFVALPTMIGSAGRRLSEAIDEPALARRATLMAFATAFALFPLPVVASVAMALFADDGSVMWVAMGIGAVGNGLALGVGTYLLLAPTLEFLESLTHRAGLDLGGVGSDEPVAVRSS